MSDTGQDDIPTRPENADTTLTATIGERVAGGGMLCRFCSEVVSEIKLKGGFICDSCGAAEPTAGPVTAAELAAARERVNRLATIGERVAGIVKTPGIDDALDALLADEDVVAANRELLEGAAQSRAELERWSALYQATLQQCNARLIPRGICLGACAPNPNGLGAVFVGVDRDQRDYTVTLTLPARERADFARAAKEEFVRWCITVVCDEIVTQQKRYLERGGGLLERRA